MADIKTGDRVKVVIEGVVGEKTGTCGHHIVTDSGITHDVFLGVPEGSEDRHSTWVEKIESFIPGHAYMDDFGRVYIRTTNETWIDHDGHKRFDSTPVRPLRKLVPEAGE